MEGEGRYEKIIFALVAFVRVSRDGRRANTRAQKREGVCVRALFASFFPSRTFGNIRIRVVDVTRPFSDIWKHPDSGCRCHPTPLGHLETSGFGVSKSPDPSRTFGNIRIRGVDVTRVLFDLVVTWKL